MSRRKNVALRASLAAALALAGGVAAGQGSGTSRGGPMPINSAPRLQNGDPSTLSQPMTQLAPVPSRSSIASPNPPSASLGNPTYDPYHSGANPGVYQPALPQQPAIPPTATVPGGRAANSLFGALPGGATGYTTTPPPSAFAPPPTAPMANPPAAYPPSIYPSPGPPVLFPGGLFGGGPLGGGVGGGGIVGGGPMGAPYGLGGMNMPGPLKFFQGPRLQHAWLGGGSDDDGLGINTTDASLAFAFPNFLYSGQPVYVLPSFSLNLFDGPSGGAADLPGQTYDAFVDVGWQSDPNQILGLEAGLRTGVFTDFDTFNSDSFRVRGLLLGKLRASPQTTLKAGAIYVNRNNIKVIPAGGLLWQPTPYSRWDIYFPNPKISHYLRTVGTKDTWGYIAAEYGGGSWTITRADGEEDSVDVNDIRLLLGLEWGRSDLIRAGQRTAFLEAGWAFQREVEYEHNPEDDFDPGSTFLLRAGIGY